MATIFSGPDLALEPANRGRCSHCSPHPRPFRVAPSLVLHRNIRPQQPEPLPSASIIWYDEGRTRTPALRYESVLGSVVKDVHCGRLSLPVAPAADDDRVAEDIRRGGRSGEHVWRSGGDVRASDGHDCAAPVSARDPLKMVAVEPRLLSLHTIESYRTLKRDHINDS